MSIPTTIDPLTTAHRAATTEAAVPPERDLESNVRSYSRSIPARFTQAAGSELFDENGRRYLDFLSGCAALNYGHNDPEMTAALVDHLLGNGLVHGLDLHTTARDAFLAALHEHILEPRGFDHVVQFTGPTGTNAIEAALKLARKVTGRTNVIAFTNGFHGVSAGALAATANQHHRMAPWVPLPGVTRALFDGYLGPDVDTADMLDTLLLDPSSGVDAPAAILLETVQCEGGLNVASDPWLRKIADISRRHGALLIVDDIQAGCGRTGDFFSFESAGITPDIVALSKSLSGFGLPFSVLLIQRSLDAWKPGEHNGTFRGNNLAFVTARVAIEKFWTDAGFATSLIGKSQRIAAALASLVALVPGSVVKGRGMLLGLETHDDARARTIAQGCFDRGLILETAGPRGSVVKLLPPLTVSDVELDEGLRILREAVESS